MGWRKGLLVRSRTPVRNSCRLGVLVGPTSSIDPATGEMRFTLDFLDLDAKETSPERIRLDFSGHGMAVHPTRRREAVLFGKRSAGGCALDLAERRVIRPIVPMDGHIFYGHGAYSREGDLLFIVETQLGSYHGSISIRDTKTFAVLGTVPSYGMAPHDCHLAEGGRTLVITNGGGPLGSPMLPSVTFVDVKSGALVERHEVLDSNRNAGHVALAAKREFAAVSAPRDGLPAGTSLGGVTLRRQGQPWVHLETPREVTSRLVGESLSVAIHGRSRTVVATHPDGGLITFWDFDRGALIGTLELPVPRGVTFTLDKRLFVISYGSDARLLFMEAHPIRVLPDPQFAPGIFAGAHLYTWTS